METIDYLKEAIEKDYPQELLWHRSLFGIMLKTNKYVKIENSKSGVIAKTISDNVLSAKGSDPILKYSTELTVKSPVTINGWIIPEGKTTIGNILMNYLFINIGLSNKAPYINSGLTIKNMVKAYAVPYLKQGKITIDEYLRFANIAVFIKGLADITVVSNTPKTLLPPEGLDNFKRQLVKEFTATNGKTWIYDDVKLVEFEERLKAFDIEWLKDDPTFGKLTSGKILNNARKKLYLTIGQELTMSNDANNVILRSLSEELNKTPEEIAIIMNSIRAASFARGYETQNGGVVANVTLRAISPFEVAQGDCKATKGTHLLVTKENLSSLVGRTIIRGKQQILLTEKNLPKVGSVINIRSSANCKKKGQKFCSVCAGKEVARLKKSPTFLVTLLAGSLLNASMKKMHGTVKATVDLKITDL